MFVALITIGCGGPAPVDLVEDGSIATVARLYGEFAAQHSGKGPKDEAEFRTYLQGLPQTQRDAMKIGDIDAFLTSPRDSQKYTIVYGVETLEQDLNYGLQGFPVVAYEAQGRDGKRLVANPYGVTADLAPAEFERAIEQ